MLFKCAKFGSFGAVLLALVGWLIFGTDLFSYVHSSAGAVQTSVKDSVPIEFELARARDLIDNIIPELQANIRLIAQDEVEIAALRDDIDQDREKLADEGERVRRLRAALEDAATTVQFSGRTFSRSHLTERLSHEFKRFKEAEIILAGKEKLLETRERSLRAAMQMLDRTRSRKAELEQQIEALVAQHRMVQASSVGSRVQVDGSQLSQAEQLLTQIKKRLDIAERVLAHEAEFIPAEPDAQVDETEVLAEVDDYFDRNAAVASADED